MKSYVRFARSLAFSFSIITLGACSSSSSPPVAPPVDPGPSLRSKLQTVVDDAVDSGLPGVSLHVQTGEESISIFAGVVNQETSEPVTSSTLFHAGSIGKTLVATLVLRLVDMGFLQLDDPIDMWLDAPMSAMIADADSITVQMLLAHTSGLPDYFSQTQYLVDFAESSGRIWAPLESLEYIANVPSVFSPDADFLYSNTNYLLLGVIAERVTGVALGMALRQWVFEPAGLANIYGAFETLGQPEISRGYIPASFIEDTGLNVDLPTVGSDLDTFAWLIVDGHGDGPIHSTPGELNSFIRTLIDTDRLLSDELKTLMMTESFPGASEHGLGMYILEGGLEFQHGGKAFGSASMMSYVPSQNVSFATVVNASFGNYDELYGEYLEGVYRALEVEF